MFNSKRCAELEARVKELETTNSQILDALTDYGSFRSMFGGRSLHKVHAIDRRITKLMDHLGLEEETISEHTKITSTKKKETK